MYAVKEMFYTLQGEGAQAGRAAVFLRFAGCNLWNGRESDRETSVCKFCDTDFIGTDGENGGKFKTADELAAAVDAIWEDGHKHGNSYPLVVCTGGEPLLQLDKELIDAIHTRGIEVAVETNGTIPAPDGIDWLCVSPKGDAKVVQTSGNEIKLVFPQKENHPNDFIDMSFENFFIQPKDQRHLKTVEDDALVAAVNFCLDNPLWRLSLQTHKIVGLK